MKRFICIMIAAMLLLAMLPVPVSADAQEMRIYLDDGNYYIITTERTLFTRESALTSNSAIKGSTTYTFYNVSDVAQWSFTLTGTFRYDGTSSTCIATSCSASVLQSGWSCSSKSSHAVGNTAVGDVTMVKKLLGITIETRTAHLTLTCDQSGNIV